MKPKLAREIDCWLGVPICFILSVFNRIKTLILPERFKVKVPQKIIFLELSEMGSALLAYSALSKAKEIYRHAEFYFWIFKQNQDSIHILKVLPEDNIITMSNRNILSMFVDILKNLWRIRRKKIDTIIDMELFSRFSSILSYLTGARNRVGFHRFSLEGLYRGSLHTHNVMYNPYVHISKNFLNLVQAMVSNQRGIATESQLWHIQKPAVPKIKSSPIEIEDIWCKLKAINRQVSKKNKIVILNPGVNEDLALRRWPIVNYAELAKRLLADPEIFIVLIGIESTLANRKGICGEMNQDRVINLLGKTSIRELLALYNISSFLVSHDSGAANLAAVTDIKIIVLFGPETPLLYAPLTETKKVIYKRLACSPCLSAYNHRRSTCRDNKCMQAISVDEVYNQLIEEREVK